MADETDSNFFSRWSRRKVLVREGQAVPPVPEGPAPEGPTPAPPAVALRPAPSPMAPPAGAAPAGGAPEAAQALPPPPPPAPTLADVAELTPQSDYTRFVAQGVTPEVKNAALKKLFTDPHFNVMDGLDIYIDDYGQPDPLPAGMLRKMVQSQALRLFADEDEAAARLAQATGLPAEPPATDAAALLPAAEAEPAYPAAANEDTAVQLQPDDDAGRAGPEPGAGQDAGRQH